MKMSAFLGAGIATFLLLVAMSFWDRDTTIRLDLLVMGITMSVVAMPIACIMLWYWFRPREDLPRVPDWNLKHDSPGRWALKGIGAAALFAGLACVPVYLSLSFLAQRVPGTITIVTGRIDGFRRGSRGPCRRYAELSLDSGDTVESCVVPKWGEALLPAQLAVGTPVQLRIKQNAIGQVLVAVAPSDGPRGRD